MASISPVAFTNGSVANGGSITVPSNVTRSHLGIAVLVSSNAYTVGSIPTLGSWVNKVSNPSVANQMEWNLFTRNGGLQAGDTIPVTVSNGTTFAYYIVWYDTSSVGANLDVNLVGAPGGRGTTNSQFTVVTGITANAGQQIIVVGSEKSTATGTNVTGYSGNYTPAQDAYAEDVSGTNTSAYFGHFVPTGAGATGNITLTYSTSSGNGVGVMLALGSPTTASFLDPFTNPNYSVSDIPQGIWQGYYSDTAAPMANGVWKIPTTNEGPYAYAWEQFDFNNSTFATEVWLDDVSTGSFSMRLTANSDPQKGWNFISCGIQAGGKLYMNQRVYDSVNGSTDDRTVYNSPVLTNGQPIVLRLRNVGTTTVYFDYSFDYQNWVNLGSKVLNTTQNFNAQTDKVYPVFATSSTDPSNNMNVFAHITQMNTNKFTAPAPPPWSSKTLWSYWDGTNEVEVPPGTGWDYALSILHSLRTASLATICGVNTFTETDTEPYPGSNTYPDSAYPNTNVYPDTAAYPGYSAAFYPGGN